MFDKINAISEKALKITRFMTLVSDTVAYFVTEGNKRGVLGGNAPDVSVPVSTKNENE